jgi:hypothetical protein
MLSVMGGYRIIGLGGACRVVVEHLTDLESTRRVQVTRRT